MDDLISRQAAISTVISIADKIDTGDIIDYRDTMVECFEVLPPVSPTRQKGEWIIIDDCEHFIAKCSQCGRLEDSRKIKDYPFCHCGADMRGENNE